MIEVIDGLGILSGHYGFACADFMRAGHVKGVQISTPLLPGPDLYTVRNH